MQKPIKEWLSELPEPYRTQALKNFDPTFTYFKNVRSLEGAIDQAFEWEDSPEGFEYWEEIGHKLANSIPLVNEPPKPPTCALEALMAIALKKGLDVQDITEIWRGYRPDNGEIQGDWWTYILKGTKESHHINLKTDTNGK